MAQCGYQSEGNMDALAAHNVLEYGEKIGRPRAETRQTRLLARRVSAATDDRKHSGDGLELHEVVCFVRVVHKRPQESLNLSGSVGDADSREVISWVR